MSKLTKNEAAEYLKCSARAVERYVAAGKIAGQYERGKTGQVLVFDESELQRFRDVLNTPVERGTIAPANARQVPTQAAPSADAPKPDSRTLTRLDGGNAPDAATLMRAVYALATMPDKSRQVPMVPVEAKLLLKLDEAAALTGLSRDTLRAAIADGTLEAKQIGRAWRVKRSDLDSYIEGL